MFEPINDRVLCRDKSYIPETTIAQTDAEKIHEAEVVAVPMRNVVGVTQEWQNGLLKERAVELRVSDLVRFNPMGVEPITIDGEKLILIRIPDIYGIIRK